MKTIKNPNKILLISIFLSAGIILTFFDGSDAKDKRPETYLGQPTKKKKNNKDQVKIGKVGRYVTVKARAPIPNEVENEMQARALSRDAAIVIAQTHLLRYIQKKETKSGMDVKTAQGVYLELKESLQGLVKGAEIRSTKWKKGFCWVKIAVRRKDLKKILKEY